MNFQSRSGYYYKNNITIIIEEIQQKKVIALNHVTATENLLSLLVLKRVPKMLNSAF